MEDLGAGIGGISAAGILLVLVVREFLQYIAKRDTASAPDGDAECEAALTKLDQVGEKIDDLQASTQAMAAILSRTDPDGLPLCYTPRSLTTSLDALAKSVERLGDKVDRISA